MPDLVRLARDLEDMDRQSIMGIREDKDSQSLWSFGLLECPSNTLDISNPLPDSITPLLHHSSNPLTAR